MVAMKRFAIITILLFTTSVAFAQTDVENYRTLVRDMNTLSARRDSLAVAISALRERYISHEAERDELSCRIVALEQQMYATKAQYDKTALAVAEYEQAHVGAQEPAATPRQAQNAPASAQHTAERQVANLIFNEFFADNLSREDLTMLRNTVRSEQSAQTAAAEYLQNYKVASALQNEYATTDNEQTADSLMTRFEQLRARLDGAEQNIAQQWSQVYDNKLYCYNLLMEKSNREDMLAYAEQSAEQTAENIGRDAGAYSSDALMRYYYKKRSLTDYETRIASALALTRAKDSLTTVASKLRKENFLLPKVAITKRYFIEYEPLKVVRPSLYNTKNPIPRTKVYEHGTIYRIRIGIFRMTPNVSAWRGVTPLSYSDAYNKGLKAYFAGGFRTEQEAADGVKYLRRLGFRDPAIVMWVDGEYITDIAKWNAEHAGKYNIEIEGATSLSDKVRSAILAQKSDCTLSKAGGIFVAGSFADKASADAAAEAVSAADNTLTVKVVKTE